MTYVHPVYYGVSMVSWKTKLLQTSNNNNNYYYYYLNPLRGIYVKTCLCQVRYIRNLGTCNQSVTSNHVYTPSNLVTAKIRRNRLGLSVKINALPGNAIFEKETNKIMIRRVRKPRWQSSVLRWRSNKSLSLYETTQKPFRCALIRFTPFQPPWEH